MTEGKPIFHSFGQNIHKSPINIYIKLLKSQLRSRHDTFGTLLSTSTITGCSLRLLLLPSWALSHPTHAGGWSVTRAACFCPHKGPAFLIPRAGLAAKHHPVVVPAVMCWWDDVEWRLPLTACCSACWGACSDACCAACWGSAWWDACCEVFCI